MTSIQLFWINAFVCNKFDYKGQFLDIKSLNLKQTFLLGIAVILLWLCPHFIVLLIKSLTFQNILFAINY